MPSSRNLARASAPPEPSGRLSATAVEMFARDAKVGLLATVDRAGRPHITLLTSLTAKGPAELMFGQFSEGLSKQHVKTDPHAGFIVLDDQRRWVRGKAVWRSSAGRGEDFEAFNRKPMFRYNAYFGIHTVHYLDLVEVEEGGELRVSSLVAASALVHTARLAAVERSSTPALTPWARRLISRLATLKFASYVGEDGHPIVIPGVAACPAGSGRLVVAWPAHEEGLTQSSDGTHVSVFSLNRALHSVLVRGRLNGRRRLVGWDVSTLDIDWVYNSMPPLPGQTYPPTDC